MCHLQIINNIVPLSLILHPVHGQFIHHHPQIKNYSIDHNLDTTENFQKQNIGLENIILHLNVQNSKYKWPQIFID